MNTPTKQENPLSAIGQLVAQLRENQLWCLIGPEGKCYLGSDPLGLAVDAAARLNASRQKADSGSEE